MNILLYSKDQLINDLIHIDQVEKILHIQTILKLEKGRTLRVGEINGLLGLATIESISDSLILLKPQLTITAPQALPCSIVLALPRPQQLKRILLHLSSLGVKEIHLLQTSRVEKNYWQSPALKHINNYLIEGLEQAQDTVLPRVTFNKSFNLFIKNTLPEIHIDKKRWFAHPGNFDYCSKQNSEEHVIFIGPEGGFTDEEISALLNLGYQGISLGSRILKVETALPILLGSMFQLP